jgi:multiple sugar transport system permease protein
MSTRLFNRIDALRELRQINTPNTRSEWLIALSRYGIVALLTVYIAFPLYWTLINAFRSRDTLFGNQSPIPTEPTIENFATLFSQTPFLTYVYNSVVVAVGTTIVVCVLAVCAGYGLTRGTFRGKRNLARVILFAYMFPSILLVIPLYSIFWHMNLLNTKLGLILAHSSRSLPLGVWIMWLFFQNIPTHYEELAWTEGVGKFRATVDVVLPLAIPGIIATAILTFAFSWNDYTMAVTILTSPEARTFPIGLNQFMQMSQEVHWGMVLAGCVVVIVPVLLIVVFFQKYILYGLGEW